VKIIVLDQNAISNLAIWADSRPEWRECRELLRKGVKNGELICPAPPESFAETAPLRNASHRLSIKTLLVELSANWYFKFPWEILAEAALSLARPGFNPLPLRFHHYKPSAGPEDEVQAQIQEAEGLMIETWVNLIPTPQMPRGETTVQKCAYKWAISWLQSIRSHLNRLRNGHPIWDDNFILQQMCGVLVDHQITDDEIRQMLADLKHGKWLEIPYFHCLYMLEGLALYQTFYHQRRYTMNFYWDAWRAAAAYSTGDVFVSEGALISHMQELDLCPEHLQLCKVNEPQKLLSILSGIVCD
jgi:hypothetical protein